MMPSVMAQVSWSIGFLLPLLAPMIAEATVCALPIEQSQRAFLADDQPLLATDAGLATLNADGTIDRFLFESKEQRLTDLFTSAGRLFFQADRQRPGTKWERQLYVMKNQDVDPKGLLFDDELTWDQSYYKVRGTVVVVLKSPVDSFQLFRVTDDRLEPVQLPLSPTISEFTGIIAQPIGTSSKAKMLFIVNDDLLYEVSGAEFAYISKWKDAAPSSWAATRYGVFLAGLRGVYRLSDDDDGRMTEVHGVPAWSITGFYAAKDDIFAGTTNGLYKYVPHDQFIQISDANIRSVHELGGRVLVVTDKSIFELDDSSKLRLMTTETTQMPWAGTEIWTGDGTKQVLVPTGSDYIYRLTENGDVLKLPSPEVYAEGIVREGRAKFAGTLLGVLLATPDGLYLDDDEGGWLRVPGPELQLKEAPDVLAIPTAPRRDGDEKGAGANAVVFANTSEGVLRLMDSPLAGVPVDFKQHPERWAWPGRQVALSWQFDNACAFVPGAATQTLTVEAPDRRASQLPVRLNQEREYPFSAVIEPEMTRASGDYAAKVGVQGAYGDVVGLGPVLKFSTSRLYMLYKLWDAWNALEWWLRATIIALIGIVSFALIYAARTCLYKYFRYQLWKLLGDARSRERIFINYRRVDKGHAKTLYLALQSYFESRLIFFDEADIEPVSIWDTRLRHAVENCSVLIVMIGPNWTKLTDPETGAPRLASPHDYVRQEIALALAGGKTIFPVLVDSATPPEERLVPDELRALLQFQMFRLSDQPADYQAQVRRMAAKIGEHQDIRCPKGTWRLTGRRGSEAESSVVPVPTAG